VVGGKPSLPALDNCLMAGAGARAPRDDVAACWKQARLAAGLTNTAAAHGHDGAGHGPCPPHRALAARDAIATSTRIAAIAPSSRCARAMAPQAHRWAACLAHRKRQPRN
jgi:hypothetical protein